MQKKKKILKRNKAKSYESNLKQIYVIKVNMIKESKKKNEQKHSKKKKRTSFLQEAHIARQQFIIIIIIITNYTCIRDHHILCTHNCHLYTDCVPQMQPIDM